MKPKRTLAPEQRASYFTQEALAAFSFLSTKYGYICVSAESSETRAIVRYESKQMYVEVLYDTFSCELDLRFGKVNDDQALDSQSFTLSELVESVSGHQGRYATATTLEQIRAAVGEWAQQLKTYGGAVLVGETSGLRALRGKNAASRMQFIEETQKRQVRENAQRAWQERDYAKVTRLYNSIGVELSPMESRRLEYADKQLTRNSASAPQERNSPEPVCTDPVEGGGCRQAPATAIPAAAATRRRTTTT